MQEEDELREGLADLEMESKHDDFDILGRKVSLDLQGNGAISCCSEDACQVLGTGMETYEACRKLLESFQEGQPDGDVTSELPGDESPRPDLRDAAGDREDNRPL